MSESLAEAIDQAVRDLITDHAALTGTHVPELPLPLSPHAACPTPLEFARDHVARNVPLVLRGAAREWAAVRRWDAAYLSETLEGAAVLVALTPEGNADAPLERAGGAMWFVKPLEREMAFGEMLRYVMEQEGGLHANGPVLYGQTQNDNLRGEYDVLFADVPKTIPFAKIALDKEPDAINFWLGNSKSTTALHKDPYENIYVQIRGQKHFTLLPPSAAACVNTKELPAATYTSVATGKQVKLAADLYAVLDEPQTTVPFATCDPDTPDSHATRFSHLCQPLKVTLQPGDMLYLPAMWYHKVGQSCGPEGFCCAVNYWFDMDYTGSFHALSTFARTVADVINKSTD